MKGLLDGLFRFLTPLLAAVLEGTVEANIFSHRAARMQHPMAAQPTQVFIQQVPAAGGQPAPAGAPLVQVQPTPVPGAAPTAPPAPPPGATATNVMNTAANIGGRAVQGAGQLAAQAVPVIQHARQGIAAAVDDAWVLPAQVLAGCYLVFVTVFFALAAGGLNARMDWLSYYYPAATHGWYTLVLVAQGVAALAVLILGMIAVADPTPGDRLNFPATMAGTGIMLISIPMAPLLMGGAIASAVHSARLAGVLVQDMPELYTQGNVYLIGGVLLVGIYYAIAALVIGGTDAFLDAVRGRDVPVQRVLVPIKWVALFILTAVVVPYGAMMYGPSPRFTDDFLNYGLVLVVIGLVLFAVAEIPVSLKTWQRVVIGFVVILVATAVWKWVSVRHGAEVDQTVSQVESVTPSRPFLTQLFWDLTALPFWNGLAAMIILGALTWWARVKVFSGTEALDGKTKGFTRAYQVIAGALWFLFVLLPALFVVVSIVLGDIGVLIHLLPPSP